MEHAKRKEANARQSYQDLIAVQVLPGEGVLPKDYWQWEDEKQGNFGKIVPKLWTTIIRSTMPRRTGSASAEQLHEPSE
jgi:hypothetical protein